jgi:hypothetical protein
VVVADLGFVGSVGTPDEAESPLIVDAEAVLPDPIAAKTLESVPEWSPEVLELRGSVQQQQLSMRLALNLR